MNSDTGEIKSMEEWEKLIPEKAFSVLEEKEFRNKLIPLEVGEAVKIKDCCFKIHCFRKDINGLVLQGISKEAYEKLK